MRNRLYTIVLGVFVLFFVVYGGVWLKQQPTTISIEHPLILAKTFLSDEAIQEFYQFFNEVQHNDARMEAYLKAHLTWKVEDGKLICQLHESNRQRSQLLMRHVGEAMLLYLFQKKENRTSELKKNTEERKEVYSQAERDLYQFQKSHEIILSSGQYEKKKEMLQKTSVDIQQKLERLEKDDEMLLLLKQNPPFSLSTVEIDLPSARKFKQVEIHYKDLESRYGIKHPRMKALRSQLKALEQSLFDEVYFKRRQWVSQQAYVEGMLKHSHEQYLQSEPLRKHLSELEQIYVAQKTKYEEAELQYQVWMTKQPAGKSIVKVPTFQTYLSRFYLLLCVGIFLLGATFGLTRIMDRRIHHPKHIFKIQKKLPIFGVTPRLSRKEHQSPLLIHHQPTSYYARSILNIRNRLMAMDQNTSKVIFIASMIHSTGSVSLVSNLAISLAQVGKKVLLIDCQYHDPKQYKYFRLSNKGLADMLRGNEDWKSFISKVEIPHLEVIVSGEGLTLNTLCSEHFSKLLTELQLHYDFIFLDVPSLSHGTDAILVAQHAGGIIFTVPQGRVKQQTLVWAKDELDKAGVPLLGIILKEVPVHKVKSWNEISEPSITV